MIFPLQHTSCTLPLKHNIHKSKFVRGIFVFDEAVILHGQKEDYNGELEQLCDVLVQRNCIPNTVMPLVLSEYRSFVEKFRAVEPHYDTDWVSFMSGFYELHCRANLFSVFKLCCLGVFNAPQIPPVFSATLPDLASGQGDFTSAIRSVQSSLFGIRNVIGLFSNPRRVAPIFSLLGKGRKLLEDPNYSVWDVNSGCRARRRRLLNKFECRYVCTITDEEREWTTMDSDPKLASSTTVSLTSRIVSGTSKSPNLSKLKFVTPTPFPVGKNFH